MSIPAKPVSILPSQSKVPFLLLAVGLPELLDFPNSQPTIESELAPDPNTLIYSTTSLTSHQSTYLIVPISLHQFESPTATDTTHSHHITALELPEFSDADCEMHWTGLIAPSSIYPWKTVDEKVAEGHGSGHISDNELEELKFIYACREDWAASERHTAVETRSMLNDVLFWGMAIDICCGVPEIETVLESIAGKESGIRGFELGYEDLGVLVVLHGDERNMKGMEEKFREQKL